MGPALYLANPIKTTGECLECHSTPAAAPKAMIAVYGSANGFGWKEDAIVGAQIVSVPLSVPLANANRAYQRLLIFLALTMLMAIVALDAGVYWFVIRPLKTVSDTADRISRGEKNVPPVNIQGKDEIATVASSFNRMQVSLAKALKMFAEVSQPCPSFGTIAKTLHGLTRIRSPARLRDTGRASRNTVLLRALQQPPRSARCTPRAPY